MTKRPLPPRSELLSRAQATAFLQAEGFPIAEATLAHAAHRGDGPPFIKFGNKTFYERKSTRDWAEARLQVFGKSPDNPFVQKGGDPPHQNVAA